MTIHSAQEGRRLAAHTVTRYWAAGRRPSRRIETMSGRLFGEHILVTGGSKGIGAAIVERCLAEDAHVSFIDIDQAGGEALLRELAVSPDRLIFGAGDVADATGIALVHAPAGAAH